MSAEQDGASESPPPAAAHVQDSAPPIPQRPSADPPLRGSAFRDFVNGNLAAGIAGALIVAIFSWLATNAQIESSEKQRREEFGDVLKQLQVQQMHAIELAARQHELTVRQLELQDEFSRRQSEAQARRDAADRERDERNAARDACTAARQVLLERRKQSYDEIVKLHSEIPLSQQTTAAYKLVTQFALVASQLAMNGDGDAATPALTEDMELMLRMLETAGSVYVRGQRSHVASERMLSRLQSLIVQVITIYPREVGDRATAVLGKFPASPKEIQLSGEQFMELTNASGTALATMAGEWMQRLESGRKAWEARVGEFEKSMIELLNVMAKHVIKPTETC